MSGYLDQNEGVAHCVGDSEYLQKPFSRDLLVYRVGAALRGDSVTAPAAESIVA
jgi:hypothetical protein